ncbi:MAG TPA: serine hydrolase domain-containing protein [Thermoleophilaceae bacterium]|nr:serine hydrolase domain-containing protein [Thermoleophilaceae bacterium]
MPKIPSLPRPPVGPDPLRRIRMPKSIGSVTTRGEEEPARAGGLTNARVDRMWKSAVDLYRAGVHPALQLCVRRNGAVVINRAIGHARGNGPQDPKDAPKERATPDTPFCVYSTSKGITALVVHMLHERGALDIEDRIVDYIPDYGKYGKDEIQIAHVLAHRAGVTQIPKHAMELDNLSNSELVIEALSDVKPSSRPGKSLAYHAVSGGFLLGEVVRVATGRSIREVLAEEILDPLGFRWTNYGVAPEDVDRVGPAYVTGPPLLPPLSTLVTRALGQPLDKVIEISNDPRFLTGIVPSANLVTNAEELSRFFEIFRRGGELDGVRVMEPETLRRALTEQSRLEIDLSLLFPTRFSYGLMLGAQVISLYGLDTQHAFGHLGLINIMGWADPERGISAALITSGKAIVYPEVARFYGVMQTITSESPKLPRSEWPFEA